MVRPATDSTNNWVYNMGKTILCNLSDANQILKNARREWTYDVLQKLGVPEEINETTDIFEFRGALSGLGIYIETKSGGEEIDIYKCRWTGDEERGGWLPISKKYLVAQWKQPKFIRKIENNRTYYELQLDEWSM